MPEAGSLPAASLFSQIDFGQGAVAAVSGGSDSTALLVLLKDHFDRFLPSARLVAVTVDHALRPASAEEAQAVARLCARLGVAHRTVVWGEPKPTVGLPAAAREARYRLLADAARIAGLNVVLTAHTADDQAETVFMRQARQEGRGLAGMAPATLYDGNVWLLRPLLGERRSALRVFLTSRGLGWIDDPTNLDPAFERPRVRATLAADEGRLEDLLAVAAAVGREREDLDRRAAILVERHATRPARGLIRLEPAFAVDTDREAALHVLRILLATAGGTSFLPDEGRVAELYAALSPGGGRATLSRTVMDVRRAGIFLYREARGLPDPSAPLDGSLWDGRYRITFRDDISGSVIGPFGSQAHSTVADPVLEGVPGSVFRAACAAEPALWRNNSCLGLLKSSGGSPTVTAVPVVAPFAHFLPAFDLKVAGAASALVGASSIPISPLSLRKNAKASANA